MNESYIPFHLKYRPQTFNNIIGQPKIISFLQSAVKENKITFAYLFIGQHGSGKTTSARVMAKAINCTSVQSVPCNMCENCINIHLGKSFDFYEIDAAKNTGIDNIREILENVQFTPIMSKYKVCVIDEVHMLSNNAFNSLLKTLESPPIKTVFILSTTAVNKIPNTIISRCQKLYFQPIKDQDLAIAISKIINNEKLKITNKAMNTLVKIAKGSLRDALSTIELFAVEKKVITAQSLNQRYLSPPIIIIELIIKALLDKNLLQLLTVIHHIQVNNWNEEIIIDTIYNLLISKYIESKKNHFKAKTIFCNTAEIISLLRALTNSKLRNSSNHWMDIIQHVLEQKNKTIKSLKIRKREKINFYVSKDKIYSN
jgi:DNA polymerase-3 subunit gamma/tau